jgi:hypothetical protein
LRTFYVDPSDGLFDLGVDSLMTVAFGTNIQNMLGKELSTTLTFDYPSSASWYCKPTVAASQLHLLRPNG